MQNNLMVNADRSLSVIVHGSRLPWSASPEAGVERRMLERIGGEVAVATSIVRYEPHSRFPLHVHELGEEFLVLEGVFSDEYGSYPAGTYVRNPPGSSHAPFSTEGCTLFVKLRQMARDSADEIRLFPEQFAWKNLGGGVEHALLYANDSINVGLLRMKAGSELPPRHQQHGEELLVLNGNVTWCDQSQTNLKKWSWVRSANDAHCMLASRTDALLWIKRGHLNHVESRG